MRRPGSTRPSRRTVLGVAGAGSLGVVAGGVGFAAGSASAEADAGATRPPVVPTTRSPYGVHQPGVTAPTANVTRVVAFDLVPGSTRAGLRRLMQVWSDDISALAEGRGVPADPTSELAQPAVDLTVAVGWGPSLFDRLGMERERPAGLTRVPPMLRDRLEERWSGGDLVVIVGADDDTTAAYAVRRLTVDARPFARVRWEQTGSWRGLDAHHQPTTGRNLLGQIDGTSNPLPHTAEFDEVVWANGPDWFVGGTTVVVRRLSVDLDAWESIPRERQDRMTGRAVATGTPLGASMESDPLDPDALPVDAHVRRAHPNVNGGARIFRRGLNYATPGPDPDSGILFLSFQADVEAQFTRIQRSLDRSDALNDVAVAIGSAEFAILPGFTQGGYLGRSLLAQP